MKSSSSRLAPLWTLAGFLSILTACGAAPGSGAGPGVSSGVLEVRFPVAKETSGARTFESHGELWTLGPARRFDLSRVRVGTDYLGFPAIDFEVLAADANAYSDLTAAHVDEDMAIVIGGELVCVATLTGRLPAKGQISASFTQAKAEALAATLAAAAHAD